MKKLTSVIVAFILIISCIGSVFAEEKNIWDCSNPECGRKGNMGNYCGGCGYPAPWIETTNTSTHNVHVGDCILFGHYEQDNNLSNGPEEIEWIVLDMQEGKALLISKYGLDVKPYSTVWNRTTWNTCTLRTWLNNDFLKTAFTTEQRSAILTTEVDNSLSQGYREWNTDSGYNTQDKIFLLSYSEAYQYFDVTIDNGNNIKSRVAPTPYAIAQRAFTSIMNKTSDNMAAGWWWLRSPGDYKSRASVVGYAGSLVSINVAYDGYIVRPAFWLNLESEYY